MDRNQKLRGLLQNCKSSSVIGIGIRSYLESNIDLSAMYLQLRELAKDNPEVMNEIVGEEVMDILLERAC